MYTSHLYGSVRLFRNTDGYKISEKQTRDYHAFRSVFMMIGNCSRECELRFSRM